MEDLLFLVHRLPYPPNKGDKIRSWNVLSYLAPRYRVHVGTFVDDPNDWDHVAAVREACAELHVAVLRPGHARLRSAKALVTGEPLTLPYYHDPGLQAWVHSTLRTYNITRVLVYSAAMAQYVIRHLRPELRSVIDFVDVDSDKWRQYSGRKRWPTSWLYKREHRNLLRYERIVAARFDASIFVSRAEAELFKTCAPEVAERVVHIENGVDTDYFSPSEDYPNPYPPGDKVLVFTGAMDYWPNVDAVQWFVSEIFPTVRRRVQACRFYIVGAHPVQAVRELAYQAGVHVTGMVSDVRPYLAHAHAAVVPLRIARGVQNKILEAMAMAKSVVATPAAMAGIKPCPVLANLVADGANALADRAVELLCTDNGSALGELGRRFVLNSYNWTSNMERLRQVLEADTSPVAHAPGSGRPADQD
ncbi:MAG: TIGR03087 family PEP-CTERM/XrtA system glycosyltransferase [Acidiferrobacterales bacterium]